jgi:hypothetical protein
MNMFDTLETARTTGQMVDLCLADALNKKGEWSGPWRCSDRRALGWFNVETGHSWHGDRGQPELVGVRIHE